MNNLLEDFDQIDKCLSCGKQIKMVKLAYIKNNINDITGEILKKFKYCNECKRKI